MNNDLYFRFDDDNKINILPNITREIGELKHRAPYIA